MIALGYGVTYIWGTVGHHPDLQVSARAGGAWMPSKAAKEYEKQHGVAERRRRRADRLPPGRAPRLPAGEQADRRQDHRPVPPDLSRSTASSTSSAAARSLGASPDLVMQAGDVVALGGRLEDLTANMGLLGPEVADSQGAGHSRSTRRRSWSPTRAWRARRSRSSGTRSSPASCRWSAWSAAACRSPWAPRPNCSGSTCCSWRGSRARWRRSARLLGKVARPSTATDLLTLVGGHGRWAS